MTTLLKQLIDSGEIVLYHDYRSGTIKDWSVYNELASVITPANVWLRNQRLQGKSPSSGYLIMLDSAQYQLAEGSIIILAEFDRQSSSGPYFLSRFDANKGYIFRIVSSTGLGFYGDTITSSITLDIKNKNYVAVSFKANEKPEFFTDGIYRGQGALSLGAITDPITNLYIGGASAYQLHSPYQAVLLVNRKLTAAEHLELYRDLAFLRWPQSETLNWVKFG